MLSHKNTPLKQSTHKETQTLSPTSTTKYWLVIFSIFIIAVFTYRVWSLDSAQKSSVKNDQVSKKSELEESKIQSPLKVKNNGQIVQQESEFKLKAELSDLNKQNDRYQWLSHLNPDAKSKLLNQLENMNLVGNSSSYKGLIASTFTTLNKKLKVFDLSLSDKKDLPTLNAYQSTIVFQVVDGYIVGADLKLNTGFSGADWDMISEILCSGAEHQGAQDPMMFMDAILSYATQEPKKQKIHNGSWLIVNHLNHRFKINYQIHIGGETNENTAHFWLSQN